MSVSHSPQYDWTMTTVVALCYFLLFLWFISVGVLHLLGRLLQWTACEIARFTRRDWVASGYVLALLYVVPTSIYLLGVKELQSVVLTSTVVSVFGFQLALVSFPFQSKWKPDVLSLLALGAMLGAAIG